MVHIKSNTHRILHRLKIVKGHLEKVIKMVEANEYCINVIHQSLAIQKSLKQVDVIIVENHLKTCVIENIKSGKDKKMIAELTQIYKYKL